MSHTHQHPHISLLTVGYPPFTDTGKVNTQAGSQIRDMFRAVCVHAFVYKHNEDLAVVSVCSVCMHASGLIDSLVVC